MRRIFFVLAAMLSLPIWAQQEWTELELNQGLKFMETNIVDVREFALSLGAKGDRAPMRGDDRDAVTISIDGARWIDRIKNMPDYMVTFYNTYGDLVKDALNGNHNALTDLELATDIGGHLCLLIKRWDGELNFTIPKDSISNKQYIAKVAGNTISQLMNEVGRECQIYIPYLHLCMNYDFPEAFWIGNKHSWVLGYDAKYETKNTEGVIKYCFLLIEDIKVPDTDIDIRIEGYRTKESIEAGISEYNHAIGSILSELPDSGFYDKVVYLNDWLTSHNCYNSALGTDSMLYTAYSPISALKGNVGKGGPVCEGYARAFKVLCDSIGIPNILAVGYARSSKTELAEEHMWNEVQMENGLWYGVDVTWNDPVDKSSTKHEAVSGKENHDWLLVGSKTVIKGLTFAQSHPNAVNNGMEGYWDYDNKSLITEEKYVPTAVFTPRTERLQSTTVHDLTGRLIGKFNTTEQAVRNLSPGMYIINGKKFVIR